MWFCVHLHLTDIIKFISSYHIFPDKYNFKLLTNFTSQHFANTQVDVC